MEKAHYGKSFTVNKVTCLSESEFNEEPVSQINAEFKKDIISIPSLQRKHSNSCNRLLQITEIACC